MSTLARARVGLPRPTADQIADGVGVLLGAALVAATAGILLQEGGGGGIASGLPWAPVVTLGGALLAVVGLAELLGRSDLRQGGTILAFALGALAILGVVLGLREGTANGGTGLASETRLVIVSTIVAWGSWLAFGSLLFGPSRAAVLVGLVTIGAALLVPVGPTPRPFAGYAMGSAWSYSLVPLVAAALAGLWRLLDLPRLGSIILGTGVLVLAAAWYSRGPTASAACPAAVVSCVQPVALQVVLLAGCLWVGLGAMFGRPARA